MQKEQQEQSFRITTIGFSVALILLCIIIAIIIFNARKLHAKNQSLINRIKQQDKLEAENEQMRRELAEKSISEPSDDDEVKNTDDLYFRLRELMKDPAIFTNSETNRKTIADLLGTNEKYIFDTVKEYYGTNISDYLNNLRLNYSRSLLALPNNKRTIEAIALEVGFNSRSVFYRLFKDQYGMTPAEFRQIVASS